MKTATKRMLLDFGERLSVDCFWLVKFYPFRMAVLGNTTTACMFFDLSGSLSVDFWFVMLKILTHFVMQFAVWGGKKDPCESVPKIANVAARITRRRFRANPEIIDIRTTRYCLTLPYSGFSHITGYVI